jgi:hypothetical protein
MSVPIIVFYHCLFALGDPPQLKLSALQIVTEQMLQLRSSGLEEAASEIYVGVNGGQESSGWARELLSPKANVAFHGLQCRSENRTLLWMEDICRSRKEAYVLYFHAKGATHGIGSAYAVSMATPWRNRMMSVCIDQWRMCVKHLEKYEAVGCHWLTGQGWDKSQHYFAGNFFWVRASFFRTIPSLATRERIRLHGPDAVDSRYESEVHLGNGPRLPTIKNYYAGPIGT